MINIWIYSIPKENVVEVEENAVVKGKDPNNKMKNYKVSNLINYDDSYYKSFNELIKLNHSVTGLLYQTARLFEVLLKMKFHQWKPLFLQTWRISQSTMICTIFCTTINMINLLAWKEMK